MTINMRLTVGFAIVLFMMVVLTVIGIQRVNFIDASITQITDVNSVKQRYAINFRGSVHDRSIALRDVVFARDTNELNQVVSDIETLDDFYQESARAMRENMASGMTVTPNEDNIFRKINAIEKKTLPLIDRVIGLKKSGDTEQASQVMLNQARPAFVEWLAAINEFIDYEEAANHALTEETRSVTSSFQTWMISLTLIAILIGVSVAWYISYKVRYAVGGEPQEAAGVMAGIAKGDLTGEVDSCCPNSMMASVQVMQQQLKVTVNNIIVSSEELAGRAGVVASGSQQALSAAYQQVEVTDSAKQNLEAMSNSIHTVADTVKQTEENSKVTLDLSKQGREAVQKVASEIEKIAITVKGTVDQVNMLQERVGKIGDIVNVIRDISEQTNLLALNAAIEAARAGEQGRGFAVVADEVRTLATRTGDATGEIEAMINELQSNTQASVSAMETTVPQVENGLTLMHEANSLLDDIRQQADDSLAKVLEIVSSTGEQVAIVSDVSKQMETIASMSHDSSESLRTNTDEASSLEELSGRLKTNINYFTVS